jgi:hypothetical protein
MKSKKFNAESGVGEFTTSAPEAAPVIVAAQTPEFLDAAGLQARFGIKRSLAYSLLADGVIRGVSLRRKNRTRGKRLFCCDSVRDYLNQQMGAGHR